MAATLSMPPARTAAALLLAAALLAGPSRAARDAEDIEQNSLEPSTEEVQGASPIQHYALDCWRSCGGAGDCAWCGQGNACCHYKSRTDPPECRGVKFWPVLTFHTCVQTVHKALPKPTAKEAAETETPAPEEAKITTTEEPQHMNETSGSDMAPWMQWMEAFQRGNASGSPWARWLNPDAGQDWKHWMTWTQPHEQASGNPAVQPNRTHDHDFETNVESDATTVVIPGNLIIGAKVKSMEEARRAASLVAAKAAEVVQKEMKRHRSAEAQKVQLPRFVTDNTLVWLQDEDGSKHFVAGKACTACGCFYDDQGMPSKTAHYFALSKQELDKMPDGDLFTCEKYMPTASQAV